MLRNKFIFVYAIVLLLLVVFVSGVLAAGTIERVSVASDGTQGNGNSFGPSISGDGRYVAFASSADTLSPNDTNGWTDVFVRDRQTNTTTIISVPDNGTQGNNGSMAPTSISGNGRYVAFASSADTLSPNDTNGWTDVFVRDRQTNITTIISVSDNGTQGNDESLEPSISGDGRYVAFHSAASNLVPNDTNGWSDVFVRDRQTNTTTIISVSDNGTQGNGNSENPSISSDGHYVVFESFASNLISNDTNGWKDIFVHDRQNHTTALISVAFDGSQSNHNSGQPNISGDGRYVTFISSASNLVINDTNGQTDIFIRDRQANHTTLVSIGSDGTQANSYSFSPSISGDGRYVAFVSWASNLVPDDTNGTPDIFVHALLMNTTARVSVSDNGTQANNGSVIPSISGDGRYIAFDCDASNLVPNDTNGGTDIFVADNPLYEHLPPSASVAAATGTGTITVSINDGGIQSLTAVGEDEVLCNDKPDDVHFPHGLISFTIADIFTGSTVTLTITFPSPIPSGAQYWSCQNGAWVDYTSLLGDDDGDEVLTLTVTDGGPGDADGVANGTIVDPGGPAITALAPTTPRATPRASPAPPRPLNPAQISVQYVSANPRQAQANRPVTITTNVVNSGDEAGNYNVALKINGRTEQQKMVSVGAQGTQPVKFTVTKSQPGTYNIDIGGQKGSFTIAGQSSSPAGESTSSGLIALVIMGVLLLATVVVLLISFRHG